MSLRGRVVARSGAEIIRWLAILVMALAVLATACGGGGGEDAAEEPSSVSTPTTEPAPIATEAPTAAPEPTATEAPTAESEPSATPEPTATEAPTAAPQPSPTETTATPQPSDTADDLPDEIERTDLLTFARGTLFVRQTGLAGGSAGTALQAIDGNSYRIALTTDAAGPVEFIYKMPADTTFDRFAIPDVLEWPGNVTFVKSVVVSGSLEGPDAGYQVLAAFDLETHEEQGDVTEMVPDVLTPVRWVKVKLEGGINIEDGDEGNTAIRFSELIANGTQETRPLSTAFDGIWDLRLTERLDAGGQPFELRQVGATISGCVGRIVLNGTVNGPIARANGVDTLNDRSSAFIFVADEDGSIQAVWSEGGGLFKAWTAVVDPATTSTDCSETPPEPLACGAVVYINFDVNSAVIRPESDQVLSDLYDGLVADDAAPVSILGHTSTEGSETYNQDLSDRRAQSVVDDLVARGYDAGAISAVGLGETAPLISPDDDETSRELNRRVEISCG